ncbi:MAG: bifunctional methylenetetrahydrofolate dehydrogenase/methenyltetrahydrofolate cyclohydrolase FolD [Candidatus Heimdallarchaeota archaeon]|nr:bifunctional methylenetetrahydrofolate dehydrogenase/methenyltetrahydrofolate cyclohydrolase FolD [Candidatus Heimdallarchaeota archaeon]
MIDGKKIASEIRGEIKAELSKFNGRPFLATILVGDDPASQVYVSYKEKACNEVGMDNEIFRLDKEISEEKLIEKITELNNDPKVNGILLQLPLPDHINEKKTLLRISPDKDVDGLHYLNVGKLHAGFDGYIPCTPNGVISLLKRSNVELEGANVVVIGRSNLVGKPVARLLEMENATVTVCHSRTRNLGEITKRADIIVAAVGRAGIIQKDMVKEGAVVIDVGTNRVDGKLVGDVDFENVKDVARLITPVPGGVGPMTITMLLWNTMKAFNLQNS